MSSKVFPGKLFPAEHQNISPCSKSICLCLMNCSGSVRREKRTVGCYPDLNNSSCGRDGSSSTSHQKMSSYDQKKGGTKQIVMFLTLHCFLVNTQSRDAFQSSAAEISERVWSIHLNGSFFTSNCWSWAVNCWDRMRNEQFRSNRARAWGGFWVGLS